MLPKRKGKEHHGPPPKVKPPGNPPLPTQPPGPSQQQNPAPTPQPPGPSQPRHPMEAPQFAPWRFPMSRERLNPAQERQSAKKVWWARLTPRVSSFYCVRTQAEAMAAAPTQDPVMAAAPTQDPDMAAAPTQDPVMAAQLADVRARRAAEEVKLWALKKLRRRWRRIKLEPPETKEMVERHLDAFYYAVAEDYDEEHDMPKVRGGLLKSRSGSIYHKSQIVSAYKRNRNLKDILVKSKLN
jgi:hypothetical protein